MFKKTSLFVVILSFLALLEPRSSQAQEIKIDGNTATIVTKDGDRITIDGNTLSRDGKNLFHSFQEFGLSQQQIATFLTNPNIQNILTRVTGGNPSYINGLIQVVGGNSNLFLMNPAGVVFGSGASINVPADFTATTATGIGFNNGVFSAVGSNDYSNLTGNPTNFVFNTNQPGSIINAGDLKVSEGSNINLIGGNVINTGSIETPHGKINIQAVAGTSRVKITPEGSLLSLELEIPKDEQGNLLGFTPQDLPTLLTGAHNAGIATPNITVKNNVVGVNGINPANGINPDNPQVQVGNVNIPEGTGSSIVSGKVSTSSETLGGEITVLGERVGVIDGEITANGAQGGGKVLIGGDFQGKGSIPNAQTTVVNKNSTITANATNNGDGGEIIVWADGNTSFTGSIEAKGGINGGDGGFVEVSGKENLNFQGKVDTSAKNGNTGTLLLDPENILIVNGAFGINDSEINDGQVLAGDGGLGDFIISENALEALPGTTNVILEATNNITIEDLSDNALSFKSNITTGTTPRTSITFRADSDQNNIGNFSMNASDVIIALGRDVNISGNNITVGSIDTTIPNNTNGNGGNITLNAANNIIIQGTTTDSVGTPFSLRSFVSVGGVGNAGNINLTSANGSISITPNNGTISASTPSGNAGNIQLNAPDGNVNLPSNIQFKSFSNSNDTGNVTLTGNSIQPSDANSTVDFVVDNEVNLNTNNLNVGINNTFSVNILNPLINVNSDNNLTLNGNINSNGVQLNVSANGSILVNNNVAINSNGGNVTLNSDRDAFNGGYITLNTGSSITANGGDIILGGGGDPLTTPAVGVANTGANPNDGNDGIFLRDSRLITNGIGSISLQGRGQAGDGNDNSGIDLRGNTIIQTENGSITLRGEGVATGNTNQGIGFAGVIENNDVIVIESTGSGNITLSGSHTGNGSGEINSGIVMTGDDSANPARITSNSGTIFLNGFTNASSNTSRGISIQANSQVNSIEGGSIYLDGESIKNNDGIGVFNNGAIITTGYTAFNTLILKDGSHQDIFIDSVSPSNFGDVSVGNNIISSARNVVLNDVDDIRLVAIKVTGNLTLNANGYITDVSPALGNITVVGTTSLNANGNNIRLVGRDTFGGTNDFNILEIVNAQDVLISDNNSLILGNSNVTGDLTITTKGTITDNGVVVVGGRTTLNSNNNDVILDSINNDFNRIGVENGNNVTLADINDVILENVDALGNPANFQITGDLDLRVAGITTINSNIQANSLVTDSNGSTVINADTITTTLNQTYNDPVILARDTQLNGNNITFNSSINSASLPQSLKINGVSQLGSVGNINALSQLETKGETTLSGNIKTTGNQIYNDAVTLANDVQLDGDNITFNSSIDSASLPQSLKINGVSQLGSVGNINALSQLETKGETTLSGNIKTTGNQIYNDAVTLANDVQLDGNNITFNSSIDSQTTPQSLTVNATNNINYGDGTGDDRIGANVGLNNFTSEAIDIFLNIDRIGLSVEQASIRTIGNQSYTSNIGNTIYLVKDTIINTKDFIVDGTIKVDPIAINGVSLTVNGTGNVDISDNGVGGNIAVVVDTALGNQGGDVVINADGNIDIGGIISTGRLPDNTFVNSAGDVILSSKGNVNVGAIGTTGSQTSGKVEITGQNVITGTILTQFEPIVSGVGGTVEISALNTLLLGQISAEAVTVTGNLAMSNFTSLGLPIPPNLPTIANSKVTTTQDQIYNGAVFLDDTATFIGREISFNGGVDSFNLDNNILNLPAPEIIPAIVKGITERQGATPRNVIIQGSQKIQLGDGIGDDRIGSVAGLASLTTTGATNININTPSDAISINTTEEQIYNNSVTLESDTILNSKNVTFNGTITGNKNLTVNTNNNGITTFNSTVTGLNTLTTNADGTTILGEDVTTLGSQNYNDAITLNNNVTLTTTDSSIEFANTVNSAVLTNNNLTVETGSGDITFNNAIGNSQELGDVSLNSSGTTSLDTLNANSLTSKGGGETRLNGDIATSGSQTYNNTVILDNNVTLTTTDSSIGFANTVNSATDTNHNLTVDTGNSNITFSGSIGDTQALGNIELNSTQTTRLNAVTANSLKTNEGGTTRLNGNVTTSGNQVYQDNLFLDTSTVIKTNNLTAVSIEANNQSTSPISLTIDASDSVTITGKPDVNTLLAISTARKDNQETGNITINAKNDINLLGAVNTTASSKTSFATTAGDISLTSTNGNVSVLAIASIGTETSGDVSISGNNIDLGPILTFLTPNNVTTGDIKILGNNTKVSGTIQGLSLTTSGTFTLAENSPILALPDANFARLGNASVTTINDQNYNNFNLANNANLNSTQGEINFTGGVNANGNDLTLISLTGVNFANQNFSSGGGNLVITTLNPSGAVFVGSGDSNNFVVTNLDRANGFDSITIGQNRNFGTITINENLTVNDPLTLQASNIFVDNTISGNDNASITLRGAKTTTNLNADIITQGNDITIDDNVIVGKNVTLSTGNGNTGNIDILGSINGNNLTLNAGSSSISLTDNISLNNFSVTANNTVFEGNSIDTTSNQNFNSNLTLTKNTNFNSQGAFTAQNIFGVNTDVTVKSQSISTQNIVTEGGSISMISSEGAVSTQNLNTSGTTGGSIEIDSNSTINTATIQTSGNNQGGNVTLNAPSDIVVTSIDTRGNNGGDVEITTAGTLRVTGTVGDGISINSTGRSSDGSVTIDLFPGDSENGLISDPRLPFVIGDASKNGTAGTINNLNFSLDTGEYVINTTNGNLNLKLLSRVPVDPNNSVNVNNPVSTPVVTFAPPVIPVATISEAQEILSAIEREAAEKPAFIYVSFTPKGFQPRDLEEEFARREATNTQEYSRVNINKPNLQPTIALKPAEDDQLDLLVITNKGEPIRVTVPVTRQQVVDSALNLSIELSSDRLDEQYKPYATELYSWLITPIEETLKEREITNLLFILPLNIRFAPLASLYDEKTNQFLVEKYSSGLAPSLNLNDNTYRSVKNLNLLAMGASEFAEDQQQTPLPGVGLELPTIKKIWNEQASDNYREFLNDNFTLETIQANLNKQPYGIIHFGTHGSFGADEQEDIFIQLYNSRLNFDDITQLGLSRSNVELMLLSACQTALGNEIAELGFAGLAVQAGVKSAIGTVWTIGDTGTLAFMTDFYSELRTQTTKAEALRQTQLNMLNGKVRKSDDGNMIIAPNMEVSLEGLPEESRQREDFSHPFYWAPFTLIGNPW